jgi:hypothetical protein
MVEGGFCRRRSEHSWPIIVGLRSESAGKSEWNGPAGNHSFVVKQGESLATFSCFSHRNNIKHPSSLLRDPFSST